MVLAQIDGKHVGNFGTTGVFSFHPRRAITTGEGGMITTQDDRLAKIIRSLRDHGAEISDRQRRLGPKPYLLSDHKHAGFNQRMTDFQAALGSAQMDRAENIVSERKRLAKRYSDALKLVSWLQLPVDAHCENLSHGFQSFACLLMPEEVKMQLRRRISQLSMG